ncbi:hypothetical protein IT409_02545, partial [Candidatus Falkowbacteria bacterium]|nr:hypothetical protein [Candidatus Falkowbacteria bacterium]
MKVFFITLQRRFQALIDSMMEMVVSDNISRNIFWHGAQIIFALSIIFVLFAVIGALTASNREAMFICIFGFLPVGIIHLWFYGTV